MLLWHPGDELGGRGLQKHWNREDLFKSNWPLKNLHLRDWGKSEIVTLQWCLSDLNPIIATQCIELPCHYWITRLWLSPNRCDSGCWRYQRKTWFSCTDVQQVWGSGKRYQAIALADILDTAKQLNSSSLSEEHLVQPIGIVMVHRHQSPSVPNVTDCLSKFWERLW